MKKNLKKQKLVKVNGGTVSKRELLRAETPGVNIQASLETDYHVTQALQGKVSGVELTSADAKPGAGQTIRVR